MLPDEEFRSRLRDDLRARPAHPVGTLAADSLAAGRRLKTRRRNLAVVGGTAAVAAVAAGSVAVSNSFGSAASATVGATAPAVTSSASSSSAKPTVITIPSTWTVEPYAAVTDPDWVTPQAIVAEARKLLPGGTAASQFSGDYAVVPKPRDWWAVIGKFAVATPTGTTDVEITLQKFNGAWSNVPECPHHSSCGETFLADGTHIVVVHKWRSDRGAYVEVIRPDGMSVDVISRDVDVFGDDVMFGLARSGDWQLKMDKAFVQEAGDTIEGDFMVPPKS